MNQSSNDLITEYQTVHAGKRWGISGNLLCMPTKATMAKLCAKSILNYGCGQTRLQKSLELSGATYYRYDPAELPELKKNLKSRRQRTGNEPE